MGLDALGGRFYAPRMQYMGSDAMAVVDHQLRVRGLHGLRVVDSSVMPTLPASNTNAASIMIGEKASDLIRGVESLQPSNA